MASPNTTLDTTLGPIRTLYCSCCGEQTRGRQFYNQDDGHGICPRCVAMIEDKDILRAAAGYETTDIERTYGKRGVHWDVEEVSNA
jgi:hypothetical protein